MGGERTRLGTTAAGVARTELHLNLTQAPARVATNSEARRVYALPAWSLHGTQPTYWTELWLRKERLADWDRVAGTTYEADTMDEVIRRLNEGADASEAD